MVNGSAALAVCVVTYKERFAQTPACASLAKLPPTLASALNVVSVSNASPVVAAAQGEWRHERAGGLPYRERLRSDNRGLAGGYNDGLALVLFDAPAAVLFLNADADVPAWYIEWLLTELSLNHHLDALAPTLMSGALRASPFRKRGIAADLYIIGHLCLRNGPFLNQLRFPDEFWLDGIDYWLSVEMARAGLHVALNERCIAHNLSVANQFGTMAPWRYRNILISERRFLRLQRRPFIDIAIVYARAMLRCLRHGRIDLARIVAHEFIVAIHE